MCYPSWNLLVQSLMSEQNLKLTMKTLERCHVGLTINNTDERLTSFEIHGHYSRALTD